MARNRSRSSSGCRASPASCNTLWLKESQLKWRSIGRSCFCILLCGLESNMLPSYGQASDIQIQMKKHILLYGLAGGAMIMSLKLIEYRFLVLQHSFEIYGGLIAAVFALL